MISAEFAIVIVILWSVLYFGYWVRRIVVIDKVTNFHIKRRCALCGYTVNKMFVALFFNNHVCFNGHRVVNGHGICFSCHEPQRKWFDDLMRFSIENDIEWPGLKIKKGE